MGCRRWQRLGGPGQRCRLPAGWFTEAAESEMHCIYAGSIRAPTWVVHTADLVADWGTCGRPEAAPEPYSLTLHASDLYHCSSGALG